MRAIARYARASLVVQGLGCARRQGPTESAGAELWAQSALHFESRKAAVKAFKTGLMVALAMAGFVAASPALAALGGDVSTVEADRVSLKGALTGFSTVKGYAVHEITTPAGVHVREYLTSDGKVFAVSWQGPFMPDLEQMLGAYYSRYTQAASAPHAGGRRHFRIAQPGLVVESNGRMRAFYGRAWDPTLLPPNFTAADIR